MTALEILRRVTKPATDAQVADIVRARYGALGRENISNDDPLLVERAVRVVKQANTTRVLPPTKNIKTGLG